MFTRKTFAAALFASAGLINVQAAALSGDGSWSEFNVDSVLAVSGGVEWTDIVGAALSFDFTVAAGEQAVLTVVDAGFAGDTFKVYNGATLLGTTSAVPVQTFDPLSPPGVTDFDLALADSAFSRATFNLGAGTYSLNGLLDQSVLIDGSPLNATLGGVRLQVSAVPEPASIALLLAGLGVLGYCARRRAV